MRRMKSGWRQLMLGLLAWGGCLESFAQVQTDSISVINLIEQIEEATSYKIYTSISTPFMVKKQDGVASLEQLKEVLKGTSWKVNVYGDRVFVMQNLNLVTSLPNAWKGEASEEQQGVKVTEVLTSENKIYDIGDKFRPSQSSQIK